MPAALAMSVAMKFLLVTNPTGGELQQAVFDYSDVVLAVAGCRQYMTNAPGDNLTDGLLEYDDVSEKWPKIGSAFDYAAKEGVKAAPDFSQCETLLHKAANIIGNKLKQARAHEHP